MASLTYVCFVPAKGLVRDLSVSYCQYFIIIIIIIIIIIVIVIVIVIIIIIIIIINTVIFWFLSLCTWPK